MLDSEKRAVINDAILHLEKDIKEAEIGMERDRKTIRQLNELYKVI